MEEVWAAVRADIKADPEEVEIWAAAPEEEEGTPEEVPALKDTSRMASKDQGRGNIATREGRKILRVSLDSRVQIYSN